MSRELPDELAAMMTWADGLREQNDPTADTVEHYCIEWQKSLATPASAEQVCCQKFDTCNERCWPLICELRRRLATPAAVGAEPVARYTPGLGFDFVQTKRLAEINKGGSVDVYPAAAQSHFDRTIANLQTFKDQHEIACAYMDEWERAGGDAPHRVVSLATRMQVQRASAKRTIAERDAEIESLKERNSEWSAMAAEEQARAEAAERRAAEAEKDAERLRWLHNNTYKDTEGYEYGVAKIKFENGQPVSVLWTYSDHRDVDAAIDAMRAAPCQKDEP
jgi:hypothetical protein